MQTKILEGTARKRTLGK